MCALGKKDENGTNLSPPSMETNPEEPELGRRRGGGTDSGEESANEDSNAQRRRTRRRRPGRSLRGKLKENRFYED
jgi:hypothetical protein